MVIRLRSIQLHHKRGSGAKEAGEGAIIADLARVMVAAALHKGVTHGDRALGPRRSRN